MSVFAEVETSVSRGNFRRDFAREQMVASQQVRQSGGVNYLNPDYYLEGPPISRDRLREDIEKFAAEHYYMSTVRPLFFDGKNWYHQNGEKYEDFFARSVVHHNENEVLRARFSAEGDGFRNAGNIVKESIKAGLSLPTMVIASPPGEVYRANQAFKARNVTFILTPVCERSAALGEQEERLYQEYLMYVVPSHETSTEEHFGMVVENATLAVTLTMLGMTMEMVRADDENCVVALPLILERGIDQLARRLERNSFSEIQEEARRMFDSDEDPLALQRREAMNRYFEEKMWDYLTRRESLTYEERLRLKALSDLMHDYMSLEAGMEYKGKTFEDIRREIEGHIMIQYRNYGVNTTYELEYTDWQYAQQAHDFYFFRLNNNVRAQESRSNGGCPVNLNQSLIGSRLGEFESYTQAFGYESNISGFFGNQFEVSISSSSSTGKYTEFYEYRKGICKHCGREKPYVAHAKREGEPCGGWCSDCET